MLLNTASASVIEGVIRQLIKLDPDAKSRLAELAGKNIKVSLTDLNLVYFFQILEDDILVSGELADDVQVLMQGTSFAFFNLSLSERGGDAIFKGEIHFSGEVGTAQKFQQFWQSLTIDWEEELSKYTGDIIAHQAGNMARSAHRQAKNLLFTVQQNFAEYMQEEVRVTPTKVEIENFYDQLEELKSDLSRMEARINRLSKG